VTGKDKNGGGINDTDGSPDSTETKNKTKSQQCSAFQKSVDATCGRKNSNCICIPEGGSNTTTSPDGSNSTLTPGQKTDKHKRCKAFQKSVADECRGTQPPGYVPPQCKNNTNCICASGENNTATNEGA